jgi:hypothetical protein
LFDTDSSIVHDHRINIKFSGAVVIYHHRGVEVRSGGYNRSNTTAGQANNPAVMMKKPPVARVAQGQAPGVS